MRVWSGMHCLNPRVGCLGVEGAVLGNEAPGSIVHSTCLMAGSTQESFFSELQKCLSKPFAPQNGLWCSRGI